MRGDPGQFRATLGILGKLKEGFDGSREAAYRRDIRLYQSVDLNTPVWGVDP